MFFSRNSTPDRCLSQNSRVTTMFLIKFSKNAFSHIRKSNAYFSDTYLSLNHPNHTVKVFSRQTTTSLGWIDYLKKDFSLQMNTHLLLSNQRNTLTTRNRASSRAPKRNTTKKQTLSIEVLP